jgi:hypothetical protein
MNALASFVASVSESALAAVVAPLTAAVVADVAAAAAAGSGGASAAASAGKSKAGLLVMLAVILRTRPQVNAGWFAAGNTACLVCLWLCGCMLCAAMMHCR